MRAYITALMLTFEPYNLYRMGYGIMRRLTYDLVEDRKGIFGPSLEPRLVLLIGI